MRFDSLIDALQTALRQELDLVELLTDEQYTAPAKGPFASSVGMHLRHNLDHFEAFFSGQDAGKVDYESRGRNTMIEESTEVVVSVLKGFIEKLESLRSAADDELLIREESEAGVKTRSWLSSSLGRELQFLLGHTVHHNALIAMIVHGHELDLPVSFGVAPSTQRYEEGRPASF